MAAEKMSVRCCVAGGGPAGMMLGLLLARAGVEVLVLEKHADFLRDFRGDTIHPSTLEVMHELGLLEDLLKQQTAREIIFYNQSLHTPLSVGSRCNFRFGAALRLPATPKVSLTSSTDSLDLTNLSVGRAPAGSGC